MIPITQPKIASLDPRWARFPGFSLLFDAPEVESVPGNAMETLVADASFSPYARALRALDPDRLLASYGFCALPPASHHVTAFDVANVADLSRCQAEIRDELSTMLDLLPGAAAFGAPLLRRAAESELATTAWNLEFGYGGLVHWGAVLAIRLAPRNAEVFACFVATRATLARDYAAAYGVGAGESYTPHLSLGYFSNDAGAELARTRVDEWDGILREGVGGATLNFRTVSLYGFTDMATFFRQRGP